VLGEQDGAGAIPVLALPRHGEVQIPEDSGAPHATTSALEAVSGRQFGTWEDLHLRLVRQHEGQDGNFGLSARRCM